MEFGEFKREADAGLSEALDVSKRAGNAIEESFSDGRLAKAYAERKMVQTTFKKLLEERAEMPSFEEEVRFLQSKAIEVIGDSSVKRALKAINLESDGKIALAVVVLDLSQSLNSLALDVLRRSDKGSADDFFKAPMDHLIAKLDKTLQLHGLLLEFDIRIPEDSGATHWTHKLLQKATTLVSFQSLSWNGVVKKCIEGCYGIDRNKIKKLFAGSIGPQNNKDYIPAIRGEFLKNGLQLDAAEGFEKMGINAIKDITDDYVRQFKEDKDNENEITNVKGVGNKVLAIAASEKEATEEAKTEAKENEREAEQAKTKAEQARKADIAERQALTQAAIKASEDKTSTTIAASLSILESLNVSKLMEKDSKAVEEKISRLTALVKKSAEFDAAGKNFQGDKLLTGLTGGALRLPSASEQGIIQSYSSNEDLVASVSGGLALHGICLLLEDEPIVSATLATLKRPDFVAMLGVATPFMTSTFKSTQETETIRFNTTARSGGMTMAESSTSGWGVSASVSGWGASGSVAHGETETEAQSETREEEMEEKKKKEKTTSKAHIIEYIKMPMKSFRIPGHSMKLSVDVHEAVRNVRTERQALAFLRAYGSHIPFGIHTVGGVFFRSISVTSNSVSESVSLFQAAGDQLSTDKGASSSSSVSGGGSYGGVTVSASASMSQASKTGSSTFNASADESKKESKTSEMFFESSVTSMGPNAPTPESFASMLSKNTGTWAVIDRGKLDQLKPIWEFIRDDILSESKERVRTILAESKERVRTESEVAQLEKGQSEVAQLEKAIRLMKRVWLRRVEYYPSPRPRLPRLVTRLIRDSIAEKDAIMNMVKSICSVISPTPNTGTRLMMLEDLQIVVEAACKKMVEESSTFSDMKTFIDLASKTDDLSFAFEVMESDASAFRLTNRDLIRAAKLIRTAGIAAKKASKDIDWNDLSEEFLYFARDMEMPYFRGDDTVVLSNGIYSTDGTAGTVIKYSRKVDSTPQVALGSPLQVAHGTTLNFLSPNGISPVTVEVTPPSSMLAGGPLKFDLYPGGVYYWNYVSAKDPKQGHHIRDEEQSLAAGNIVFVNTCDVDALQAGEGAKDEGGIPKRSSILCFPYDEETLALRKAGYEFTYEFWWVSGLTKTSKTIKAGHKYYICPQAFNPHYALSAPRILSQEEMDSEQRETRSSQPGHDYFGGKFAEDVEIINCGSLRVLVMGKVRENKESPGVRAVSNEFVSGWRERRWNIERTTSPILKGDEGCYRITHNTGFCLKAESESDGISVALRQMQDGNQKWRFVKQDVSHPAESEGDGDSGIYLIVNAVSGRRLYADQEYERGHDGLGATDSGVVSENEKWLIRGLPPMIMAVELPVSVAGELPVSVAGELPIPA
jgi:hypothetical protein